VIIQIVSPAEVSRYQVDLTADQAGWTTPPSNATLQALAQQSGYQTAYQQFNNFSGHNFVLLNVAYQSYLYGPRRDAIGTVISRTNFTQALGDYNLLWTLAANQTDMNLTSVNFTNPSAHCVISPSLNRYSRMAGQTDANDVFPIFGPQGVVTQPWYVSIVDQGTSYNGTSVNWFSVTFQHSWLLGWYLGVCADCEWGQTGPAVVMIQSNETDPRVQWMMFQVR